MATGPWGAGTVEPIRVKIAWSFNNNRSETGFYLRTDGPSLATLTDVVNHVVTNFLPAFRGILLDTDQVVSISALNIVTGEAAEQNPASLFGSISATAAAPNFLMVPVSFKSGLRRRYGQGRGLWPVRAEVYTDADVLTTAGVTLFQAAITSLTTNYVDVGVGDPYQMINIHGALAAGRPNGTRPTVPAVPATYYDVQTIILKRQLSSLHSRKIGVGS